MFRGCTLFKAKGGGGRCRGNSFKIIENGGGLLFLKLQQKLGGGRKVFIINRVKSPLLGKHHISL